VLLEATLRCLQQLPPARVTARIIAAEADANLASIAYHFGSKEGLVTEAVVLGLDRWLVDVEVHLASLPPRATPAERLRDAADAIVTTRGRHGSLAAHLVGAMARAQHDARVRDLLADGFRRTRPQLARVLLLGDDEAADDAAGLLLAMFSGHLLQLLLAPDLAIDGDRMVAAQRRLRTVLPR
jgi:AcrR family transcriptional regulator